MVILPKIYDNYYRIFFSQILFVNYRVKFDQSRSNVLKFFIQNSDHQVFSSFVSFPMFGSYWQRLDSMLFHVDQDDVCRSNLRTQ